MGNYKVSEYENKSSADKTGSDIKLYLLENNDFEFDLDGKKVVGKWEAYDNGDLMLIDFKINNLEYQGMVGGNIDNLNEIKILNPESFLSKDIINITFKK
ncbi:hypothetical protein HUK80_17570 [Flavobacterium sp. MAH-1]|uniref:Uncharacterized protein n=1 Tax=Flavobacterium agri TaxID=2743471 RepID=A0A7Y9C7U5_9FLAO|nr:hypothetical protein [Flavobacterium agri]NUY82716.1 hypothetical protein [Flavobacterium agri]NYA72739.1 hypothetical protein [Flavobacterium agri]